jgi:cephalosporin-C deacetylase-like acetyl esterase
MSKKSKLVEGIAGLVCCGLPLVAGDVPELALKSSESLELVGHINKHPIEYAVNEPMKFTFTLECKEGAVTNQFGVVVHRGGDDGVVETKRFPIKVGETITYETSISEPGFVDVRAHVESETKKRLKHTVNFWGGNHKYDVCAMMGAGADVSKLTQTLPEPADFDEYWSKELSVLDPDDIEAELECVNTNLNGKCVYAVKISSPTERPVTGYLVMDPNAPAKSQSATVSFQGYGCQKQAALTYTVDGIFLEINAHGYDLGKEQSYYAEFNKSIMSNGHGYAMDPEQNTDPNTAYFHDMVLRVIRALQYVKSLPQWDGKNLTVSGGSQGGLQSVWAAAHDSDVTKCKIGIVWCCDIGSQTNGKLLKSWHPQWVDGLGYYDAVNHAKRITCPVEFDRIGLGDYTCSPHSNAVLYNSLQVPVKAFWYSGSDHGYVSPWSEKFETSRK